MRASGPAALLAIVLPLLVPPPAAAFASARAITFEAGGQDDWLLGRVALSPDDWAQADGTTSAVIRMEVGGVAPDAIVALDVLLVRDGRSLLPYVAHFYTGPTTATVTITPVGQGAPSGDAVVVVAADRVERPLTLRVTLNPDASPLGSTTARPPLASGRGAQLSSYVDTEAPLLDDRSVERNVDASDSRAVAAGPVVAGHEVSIAASREAKKPQLTYLSAHIAAVAGFGEWNATSELDGDARAGNGTMLAPMLVTRVATVGVTGYSRTAAIALGARVEGEAIPTNELEGVTIPVDLDRLHIMVQPWSWMTGPQATDALAPSALRSDFSWIGGVRSTARLQPL